MSDKTPEKEGNFIVYKITNLINGKIYIGQTIHTIKRRKREHINNARGGLEMALYRAMRKYGTDNFIFEPIYYCSSREEVSCKERVKNSLAKLGNKNSLGRRDSDETRAKKSESLKRYWQSVRIS